MTSPERPYRKLQSVEIENALLTEKEKHSFIYVNLETEVCLEKIEPQNEA